MASLHRALFKSVLELFLHGLGIVQLPLLYSHRDPLIINQPLHSINLNILTIFPQILGPFGEVQQNGEVHGGKSVIH